MFFCSKGFSIFVSLPPLPEEKGTSAAPDLRDDSDEQDISVCSTRSSDATPYVHAAATAGCSSENRDSGDYRLPMLRDRCTRLEQDLRVARGALAILKSKQPRPAEREAFLLEELEKPQLSSTNSKRIRTTGGTPGCLILIGFANSQSAEN